MRGFLFGALVVIACGGETTNLDAGADVTQNCWSDPRTVTDRQCTVDADCSVVDHVADCCGSIVVNGVRSDRVNDLHNAETAANAGCPICKCLAKATVDESGQSGNAYLASCIGGLCTAHAQ